MRNGLPRNCSTKSEICKVSSEENNNYCAYNGQFPSSDSSRGGKTEKETHARSPTSMGSTTSPELDEILPLTGKPYFVAIMSKSYVQSSFRLVIPNNFTLLLPTATVQVGLWCRNKRWEVRYRGDRPQKWFDGSWRKFAEDNELKVGDACVFELIDDKKLEIRVQILDGKIPPDFPSSEGDDAATPIVLD